MENLNLNTIGGYAEHFIDELKDKYICPVCLLVLFEPVQTECGHRICKPCSEEIRKRNKGVFICPLDKSISEKHLDSCDYQEVKCINEQCSASLLRKELNDHIETSCIYRVVFCQYCDEIINYIDLQFHLDNCKYFPVDCLNQCGIKILREQMTSHIADGCALTVVPCQYLNIGCNFKGTRKEQDVHFNLSTHNHLEMSMLKLAILEKHFSKSNEATTRIENKVTSLESNVTSIKKIVTNIEDYLKNIHSKQNDMEKSSSRPEAISKQHKVRGCSNKSTSNKSKLNYKEEDMLYYEDDDDWDY